MKAIMYHYVRPTPVDLPYFRYLHIDDFCQQLDYFSQHDRFLTKTEFLDAIKAKSPPPDGTILTFDDGLRDHYDHVLPALKERGLWGIFYIPTGMYVNQRLLDVHRIHMLLGANDAPILLAELKHRIDPHMLDPEHSEQFHNITYQCQHNDEATTEFKRILNYYIAYQWRTTLLDDMMAHYFPDETRLVDDYYMTAPQIREMENEGMIIGSHTVSHRVMSKLSRTEQRREIDDSFAFLDKITTRRNIRTFCHPYGGFHTFTADTEKLLTNAECAFSFNVEARNISESDLKNRPQALPRFDCNLFPHGKARDIPTTLET